MSTKLDLARQAAHNNADLCSAIMAAHRVRTQRDSAAFLCLDPPPPFYPEMITLDPNAHHTCDTHARTKHTVKDSFASLDADALGLHVAIEATWIWCASKPAEMPTNWVHITSASDLSVWHQAWRGGDVPADQVIFTNACLDDPNLAFIARVSGSTIEAGCVANISSDVIGLSNVFSADTNDAAVYEQALAAVSTFSKGRPVVGYEQGKDLESACLAGFQQVGPLRVLIRPTHEI